jgi:hypothetical protein
MTLRLSFTLLLTLVMVGCASRREAGWSKKTEAVSLSAAEAQKLQTEALQLWRSRHNPESLREALAKFETLHSAAPQELAPLILLTRGNYFLAEYHISDEKEKLKTYERAAAFGEKAMATNEAFRSKVDGGESVENSLDTLTVREVPAIYWTAASYGKWAKASGIATMLKYKTRIRNMVERVEKLDPNYFFGAVPRYWGGFYAVAPSFAGGDMKKSRAQFDRSIAQSPEYQGTKVLMAEVYWTKEGKKAEFQRTLREVLSSQQDSHAEVGPENIMEKKKAQQLLNKADELF